MEDQTRTFPSAPIPEGQLTAACDSHHRRLYAWRRTLAVLYPAHG